MEFASCYLWCLFELISFVAELFSHFDIEFACKGTMGNLVSIMSHCWGRGFEVLLGDTSHIHIWEQGGIAQVDK